MQLFLISDKLDPVIGMRLAGVEGLCVRNATDAAAALQKAAQDENIGILLCTAGIRALCPEETARLQRQNRLLFLEIPDGETLSGNQNSITAYIQEAVGIQL